VLLKDELKRARISAGISQEELAARANVSREYVGYVERGKNDPTVKVFIKLCRAMDVYPPEILKRVVGARSIKPR
jgi:transcriptional regulator with XRE-family HTH domain